MKQIKHAGTAITAFLLGTVAVNVQAELSAGDTLHFTSGSKVSMEVSPGFWVDSAIEANRGLVIGTAQPNNKIDKSFRLFDQPTTHKSNGPVKVIGKDGAKAMLDFSSWAMDWQGNVIALNKGGTNEQGAGVALVSCENNCSKGESFTLDYSATMPSDANELGGLAYRLHMTGTIE